MPGMGELGMSSRVDRASRIIQAPAFTIYGAFTDPKAMESWLPPAGMTGQMLAFDFREGGGYRMRLTYEDARGGPGKSSADADDFDVRFVRLIEDRCIEQAVTFDSEDSRFSGVMRMTGTFGPTGSATEVTVQAENVPEGISAEDHTAGMTSTLANLAKLTE